MFIYKSNQACFTLGMPSKNISTKRTVNSYYLLASASVAVTAILILPFGNSYFGYVAYVTALLALIFGAAGLAYKKNRSSVESAVEVGRATSAIYALEGILVLLVLLSQLTASPKIPPFSDFDFINYLQGWPVIEIVLLGTIVNALFRLSKPSKWLVWLGSSVMFVSVLIWLIAAYYGHITNP